MSDMLEQRHFYFFGSDGNFRSIQLPAYHNQLMAPVPYYNGQEDAKLYRPEVAASPPLQYTNLENKRYHSPSSPPPPPVPPLKVNEEILFAETNPKSRKTIKGPSREASAAADSGDVVLPKKRVTKAYSPCQKIQYVDVFRKEQEEKGRSFSQRQFARKHQLSHARFSAWCKEYDKLKSLDASQLTVSRVRRPSARFPVLEARVAEWVGCQRSCEAGNPSVKAIQSYARSLAGQLNIPDFVASNTWVERFRRRCDIPVPAAGLGTGTGNGTPVSAPVSAVPGPVPAALTPFEIKQEPEMERPVWECDDFSIEDNLSTNIQDSLIDEILQEFLARSDSYQSPLEIAGMGLTNYSLVPKLQEIHLDGSELEFAEGASCSSGVSTGSSFSQPHSDSEPGDHVAVHTAVKRVRHMYTPKQRRKYVQLYHEEKTMGGAQYSLRLFCKRYKISRSRMAVWLKQHAVEDEE